MLVLACCVSGCKSLGKRIVIHTRQIMALAGVAGKGKDKNPITTHKGKSVDTRPDLVQRDFKATSPNRLRVGQHHLCTHL